jgi:hypothetical protein
MTKEEPKVETIEDPIFAKWIADAIRQDGERMIAKVLKTTPSALAEMISTSRIPQDVFDHATGFGFVAQAAKEGGSSQSCASTACTKIEGSTTVRT